MIRGSAQAEVTGSHAEKDILDGLHAARTARRFPAAFLVGLRCHHPNPFCRMVGRLPQRLVLGDNELMSAIAGYANDPPTVCRRRSRSVRLGAENSGRNLPSIFSRAPV